jgi:NADPH-dependent 7-cyano-7-deazaguanine reductase QueF-like protein
MLKEKLRSRLNITGTPHVAVPHVFVELCLWVVGVGLPCHSPLSFHGLGKMSKEKSCSGLNLTGTPHVAVPHVFVELRLRVVGVGIPRLSEA